MSESAYLIWKLRNERTTPNNENGRTASHTPDEIQQRWLRAINERLESDCKLTDKKKYKKKALKQSLVEKTWEGTLLNEGELPHNWARGKTEVLVGIEGVG